MDACTGRTDWLETLHENSSIHHDPIAGKRKENRLRRSAGVALMVGPADCRGLGDQLRPQILTNLLDFETCRWAGLISKDLSDIGGRPVVSFRDAAGPEEAAEVHLIHTGGNALLSGLISGYHNAAEGPEEGRFTSLVQIAAHDEMVGYVKRRSGQSSSLAYVLAPQGSFSNATVSFFGLRLPEPSILEDEQEEHLVYCAGESAFVGVSGKRAEEFLTNRGIVCHQMPCPLSALPYACSSQLQEHSDSTGALPELRNRFKGGWIAVEVGKISPFQENDFAAAVAALAEKRGWGIAAFSSSRIGQAEEQNSQKWTELIGPERTMWIGGTPVWDLVQVIRDARLYSGGCLDSRIVASSFAVPRISVPRSDQRHLDYCELWDDLEKIVLDESPKKWCADLEKASSASPDDLKKKADSVRERFMESLVLGCKVSSISRQSFAGEQVDHWEAVSRSKAFFAEWSSQNEK